MFICIHTDTKIIKYKKKSTLQNLGLSLQPRVTITHGFPSNAPPCRTSTTPSRICTLPPPLRNSSPHTTPSLESPCFHPGPCLQQRDCDRSLSTHLQKLSRQKMPIFLCFQKDWNEMTRANGKATHDFSPSPLRSIISISCKLFIEFIVSENKSKVFQYPTHNRQ